MAPRLSVIMPTYNKADFVRESVESILSQDFRDLELLVLNDGSTDHTRSVLDSIRDPRLTVIHREHRGIMPCMNEGLEKARGELISRMDHDDLSLPGRFSRQIAYLDQHPEIDALGCRVKTFGRYEAQFPFRLQHDEIKAALMFEAAMNMSAVIVRRKAFEKAGYFYDDRYRYAEDCDLWYRLLNTGARVENLPDFLFSIRIHEQQASHVFEAAQTKSAEAIFKQWLALLKLTPTEEQFNTHMALARQRWKINRTFYLDAYDWIQTLLRANLNTGIFSQRALQDLLEERWLFACLAGAPLGPWIVRQYWNSHLQTIHRMRPQDWIKWVFRCCRRATT